MICRSSLVLVLLLLPSPFLTGAASAQYYSSVEAPLTASGVASLERSAERMHMVLELSAEGADVRTAATALSGLIESAAGKLTELGAESDSIRHDPIQVKPREEDAQAAMMRSMGGGFPSITFGGQPAVDGAAAAAPSAVRVAARLHAEWTLTSGDPLELLVSTHEIQTAVRNAKLEGEPAERPDLTDEERELMEEAMMFAGSSGEESGPVFYYLATISAEDNSALLKEAFEKAVRESEILAAAIGMAAGPVTQVSQTRDLESDWNGYDSYSYGGTAYQVIQQAMRDTVRQPGPLQIVGNDPQKMSYSLSVTVGRALVTP